MCGICASVGDTNQIEKVIKGLKKLEYRGYDSSGIAFKNGDILKSVKSVGQINKLEEKIGNDLYSNLVIGHTRWATHGKPSIENSHPHFSEKGEFSIVHNGIIENYEQLKEGENFKLISQTDTEVFVNYISVQKGSTLQKILKACREIKGSFAIALLDKQSDKLFFAKRNSPLMVAHDGKSGMVASDMSVLADNYHSCWIMDDDEFGVMTNKNITFFNKNGEIIKKNKVFFNNSAFLDENNDEKFYMLREIKQQPFVLSQTYNRYFREEQNVDFDKLREFESYHFIACGTAYHSCLLGAKYIEKYCRRECKVSLASEFRYDNLLLSKSCLYIFVSQSGETADTIACAKLIKKEGAKCLAVTNVPYCSLNNECDFIMPTFAGKEIAVASTKAYTAQVFTLLILALKLSGNVDNKMLENFVETFTTANSEIDEKLLDKILTFKKIFFIGRGQDYVTSLEGALKLKEVAYINCIGMAGGEFKHGSLALVDNETLVIALSTQRYLKEKIESNILEVKARGGSVLLLSQFEHDVDVEFYIHLNKFDEDFMPIASIVPLQRLAFDYAIRLGCNPDKPRNLAKSVTVE